MRDELIFTIRTLADRHYQEKVWVDGMLPREGYGDNFDQAIHFLFDDMTLDTNLQEAIGIILMSKQEADAVGQVVNALEDILEDVRWARRPDEDIVMSPYWEAVLSSSRIAYKVLSGGKNPDGFFEELSSQSDPQ
jgi:hypothetical protein